MDNKCYRVAMWGCPKPNPNVRYVWADCPMNAKCRINQLDWKATLVKEQNGKMPNGTVLTKEEFNKIFLNSGSEE